MSTRHLIDLRDELERCRWVVVETLDGNDYDVSGVWVVSRKDGRGKIHLEFEGLEEMNTLPIERAYGCRVRELPGIGLYFARSGRSWPKELERFGWRLESQLRELD